GPPGRRPGDPKLAGGDRQLRGDGARSSPTLGQASSRRAKNGTIALKKNKHANSDRGGPRRDILAGEVLGKAGALFAAGGFAATSLQDVADKVRLSRTAIYYYFDSKDALLQELARGVTSGAMQIFDELDAEPARPPSSKVHEAARRLVLWVTDPH